MASTRPVRDLLALGGIALGIYGLIVRPWHCRWGATSAEVAAPMPGDDLVDRPSIAATRATTIDAPPSAVWPWIVQMGYGRAGWYSYDALDNQGVHVRRIIPELQHLEVGDRMLTDATGGFRVEAIDRERSLVLLIRPEDTGNAALISCTIQLVPYGSEMTRLVVRVRARFGGVRGIAFGIAFDFGDFVMMRRQILGIRERAERAWLAPTAPSVEPAQAGAVPAAVP